MMDHEAIKEACRREEDIQVLQPVLIPLPDDADTQALKLLDEWKDLWDLIKGYQVRQHMGADLYSEAIRLRRSTGKFLRDWDLNHIVGADDICSTNVCQTITDFRVEEKK